MGGALGPGQLPSRQRGPSSQPAGLLTRGDPRDVHGPALARVHTRRWVEATGAHLLVVDPAVEGDHFGAFMASRGVHVTMAASTLDGLVEFGRIHAAAVVVAPDAAGLGLVEFVETIRRFGTPYVIAVVDPARGDDGIEWLPDDCGVVERPYDPVSVWHLLESSGHAMDEHLTVAFGPIALDSRTFTVRVRGERIHDLPLKEFELLGALMQRAPEIMSNDELRVSLWGPEGTQILDNTLAVHVARLRNRLQGIARIRRIRGRGYALTLD
jgi:DNA-binding response OmpR family regulator